MASNTEIIDTAYGAFAAGDIPTVIGLLADDVSWVCPGVLPQAGDYKGPGGVVQFFEALGAAWSSLRLDIESVGNASDNTVVGIVKGVGQLTDGTSGGYGAVHVFTIRDGKIATFREYTDLGAAIG